jgi:hypothetical protein
MTGSTPKKRFQQRNITTLLSELKSKHPATEKRIERLSKLRKAWEHGIGSRMMAHNLMKKIMR